MVPTRWTMAALTASPSADCASMMQSRKHCLALSARALSPLQPLPPSPVGRSNSPGYGHLKLRHGVTTGSQSGESQIPPPRPPAIEAPVTSFTSGFVRSACEPHRSWIEQQVRLKRNAQAIYQDLVDQYGFAASYESVKRFCRTLRHTDPHQFDRLEFLPGEEAQVDYGEGALTVDPKSGRYRPVH